MNSFKGLSHLLKVREKKKREKNSVPTLLAWMSAKPTITNGEGAGVIGRAHS